jgi:S-adenosylmethionine/arginine decarboxylase-like enzyme
MMTLPSTGRLGLAAYRQLTLPEHYVPPSHVELTQTVCDAALAAGVTVVGRASCQNNLGGVTAAIAVAESQIVVAIAHTTQGWSATVDVFYCGQFDPLVTMEHLAERLGATSWTAPRCRGGLICRSTPGSIERPLKLAAVDLYGCKPHQLDSIEVVGEMMLRATERANLKVADSVLYHFSPQGVTGLVIGPAVTLTAHTWPEYGVACIDLESRNPSIYRQALASLQDDLGIGPNRTLVQQQLSPLGLVERGTQLHLMADVATDVNLAATDTAG